MKSRLEELYKNKISKELMKELELKNVMQVPALTKIVLNIGVKEAVSDSKAVGLVKEVLDQIACQSSAKTLAKKSIASFKLREGVAIGVMVTLRGSKMYHFLDKLINVVLPSVRDFQGVRPKLMGMVHIILGLKTGWYSLKLITIKLIVLAA